MPERSASAQVNLYPNTAIPADITLVFPAREISVRHAVQSVCKSLKSFDISDLTLVTVEIILAEVMNNIVEHAYARHSGGDIDLSCSRGSSSIHFEVIDQGKMFPGGEIPSKQNHDLGTDLQDLPEGGFGWGLIRDMTTLLAYRRCEGRNILRFSVAVETI